MTRLVIAPPAAFEIGETAAAYEATRPGLGRTFVRHIHRTLAHVRQFPELAPVIEVHFRRAVIHRFPFCIVYRVKPDEVQVLGVLPTRADANRLLDRLTAASRR